MVSDPASTISIQDALDRFLVQLEADGRSEHTIGQYERHVQLLVRWLVAEGKRADVGGLHPQLVAEFMVSPVARVRSDGTPRKATSVNALRSSIRCFCAHLRDAGLVQANPAALLRRAICSPRHSRALDEAEVERLRAVMEEADDAPGRRDRVLFSVMLATGIRIGSALGLDIEDVDLERGELLLRRTKGNRVDRVFVPETVVTDLVAFLDGAEVGPLFRNGGGGRLTARHANRRLARLFERAGIHRVHGSHALRHTFATRLYGQTRDVLLVQQALCHRSLASTLLYAHLDPRRLKDAVNRQV